MSTIINVSSIAGSLPSGYESDWYSRATNNDFYVSTGIFNLTTNSTAPYYTSEIPYSLEFGDGFSDAYDNFGRFGVRINNAPTVTPILPYGIYFLRKCGISLIQVPPLKHLYYDSLVGVKNMYVAYGWLTTAVFMMCLSAENRQTISLCLGGNLGADGAAHYGVETHAATGIQSVWHADANNGKSDPNGMYTFLDYNGKNLTNTDFYRRTDNMGMESLPTASGGLTLLIELSRYDQKHLLQFATNGSTFASINKTMQRVKSSVEYPVDLGAIIAKEYTIKSFAGIPKSVTATLYEPKSNDPKGNKLPYPIYQKQLSSTSYSIRIPFESVSKLRKGNLYKVTVTLDLPDPIECSSYFTVAEVRPKLIISR